MLTTFYRVKAKTSSYELVARWIFFFALTSMSYPITTIAHTVYKGPLLNKWLRRPDFKENQWEWYCTYRILKYYNSKLIWNLTKFYWLHTQMSVSWIFLVKLWTQHGPLFMSFDRIHVPIVGRFGLNLKLFARPHASTWEEPQPKQNNFQLLFGVAFLN